MSLLQSMKNPRATLAASRNLLSTLSRSMSIEVSKTSNGITVVSQHSDSGISAVGVTVGAGSNLETSQTSGVTHYLRNLAFQNTASRSGVRIAREADANGIQYSAESGRDYIQYKAHCLSKDGAYVADILTEVVGAPNLEDWEVPKQNTRVSQDIALAYQGEEFATFEVAHQAAFFNTALSNSPLCSADRIGAITGADVRGFRNANFTTTNTVVAGVGVAHSDLVAAAEKNLGSLSTGAPNASISKYTGGQIVVPTAASTANMILGFQGAARNGNVAAALILRNLFGGNGSSLKWATDATASKIGAAVSSITSSPFNVSGFSASYANNGLVGVHVVTAGVDAGKAIVAVAEVVKSIMGGNVSDADFAAAKAKARFQLLSADSIDDALQGLTASNLFGASSAEQIASQIASFTVGDLKKFTTEAASKGAFLAARGNVDGVLPLKDLGLQLLC